MLSFELDQADYLPYIDGNITNVERERVEELIRAQMPSEMGILHPHLGELAPLSENRSLLMRDLARFEAEDFSGTVPDTILPEGVSMNRYTDFSPEDCENIDENNVDLDKMYTALSYSVLRERNAQLGAENSSARSQAQSLTNEQLQNLEKLQEKVLSRKRERVDEIQASRQAKQKQFQPVEGYLEHRWKDGISNLVDMGLERQANGS